MIGDDSAFHINFACMLHQLIFLQQFKSDLHIYFVFRCGQALSQSDGRWSYSSDNPESSTYAAGNSLL